MVRCSLSQGLRKILLGKTAGIVSTKQFEELTPP